MKDFSIMLKPSSSACNLRCKYCFYADLASKRDAFSFGFMSEETVDAMLTNLRKDLQPGDVVTLVFQGGEPTLIGLEWFQRFVQQVEHLWKEIQVKYALQTNGITLDERWAEFLYQNRVLVGLSLDGMPQFHNGCRVDIDGNGTYGAVLDSMNLMRKYHVEFNVLCTLTSGLARHPAQVWKWICQNEISYIQFTPCMDELGGSGASPYALHPKKFASFYMVIFPCWLHDFSQGRYRSIKLFDDIVNLLAYGLPTACGIHGKCQCQMVVEADGSCYPCDFYCMDDYRLGNLRENSIVQMVNSGTAQSFLSRPREEMIAWQSCRYQQFCGGCRRMQREVYCVPGDTYCGYREFLNYAMPDLQRIALRQRRYRMG